MKANQEDLFKPTDDVEEHLNAGDLAMAFAEEVA